MQVLVLPSCAKVSAERLREVYGGEPSGLLGDMRKIMELLGLPPGMSPFESIAAELVGHVRQGAR